MSEKLNIFEMLRLSHRANRDVKADVFRTFHINDPVTGQLDQFVISGFITYDLGRFERERTCLEVKKRCRFWTPSPNLRRKRRRRLPVAHALGQIDSAYARIQIRIHQAYNRYNKAVTILAEQTALYAKDNAPHYAQLCHNKSAAVRDELEKDTRRLYELSVDLLNQKIEILTKLMSKSELARARCISRVRYYYGCAAARDPKIPVQFLSDERLSAVANLAVLDPKYYRQLKDAYELLGQVTRDVDALFSGGKEVSP